MNAEFTGPERLNRTHNVAEFSCGKPPLDEYLKRYALQDNASGANATYVVLKEGRVVAYFAMCPTAVPFEAPPARFVNGLAQHPYVAAYLLSRLAVDTSMARKGLGTSLLMIVFESFLEIQAKWGGHILVTDAKDEEAKAFYERFGFQATEDEPLRLYILAKTIRASLRNL